MSQMAEAFARAGWRTERADVDGHISLRTWMLEANFKRMVDLELARRMTGPRAIALKIAGAIGQREASLALARGILEQRVGSAVEIAIEQQLMELDGLPGVSVKKGAEVLFEATAPEAVAQAELAQPLTSKRRPALKP